MKQQNGLKQEKIYIRTFNKGIKIKCNAKRAKSIEMITYQCVSERESVREKEKLVSSCNAVLKRKDTVGDEN